MGDKKVLTVNKELFFKRALKLYNDWTSGENGLSEVDAMFIMVGQDEDAPPYSKSSSFQTWMFSCELLDTLMVLTKTGIWVLGSNRKADYFGSVAGDSSHDPVPELTPIHRDKSDKDAANFEKLISHIKDAGGRLGCFTKDKFASDFSTAWEKAVEAAGIEKVDVAPAFVRLFAVKDANEIEMMKNSANATVNTWAYVRKKYVEIIDSEKKTKHSRITEDIEKVIGTAQVQGGLSKKNIDTCYSPIVMSGGSYSFKWSNQSSDKFVHFGAIVTSLGARYENYCSNVSRTMLVDPSKELEENYEAILSCEMAVVDALVPGAKLSEVYEAGVSALKQIKPDLVEKMHKKELGFLTGLEFRESTFAISPKCEEKVRAGMVFVVYIGVEDMRNTSAKDEAGKKAAIAISDTVLVNEEGKPTILTEKAKSRLKSNVIRFKEEEAAGKDEDKENTADLGRGKRSVVLTDQTRNKTTNEDKRKERQKELAAELNKQAQLRISQQTGASDTKKVKRSNISYKSFEKFPRDEDINNLLIYVDRRHDSVILPIFGVPCPFHISMIKNCSQSVEGDFTYLRVNFAHPGSQIGKENAMFPNPLATYLKELTFRSSNIKEHGEASAPSNNLSTAFRLIKEMQKKFRTEEAEEREKEGAVKQDKLVVSASKINPKLKDLFVRPNIIAKRISGSLEAHTNGFRYTSLRGDKIDVLYNNIKHAFFQPCDNEMIILLHFHLKNPVLWGKKKYKDVQFFTEVGEITTDLGKFHHMQDRDDIHSEQMEREMRRKLNQAFQSFCDKVVKQTNDQFDFDTPFSELGFFGVPHRSSCTLKPTSACLVNLTEWPPFVVTLEEVELVHFERVSFQLKNFDMVFIFKDYSRKTQMVQQIPTASLDSVKEWLNSCDIRYTEGIQSLNWPKIMKTITDDPEAFFEDGGWNFLSNDSDDEAANEDEDESSEAYSPTEDDESGSNESDSDESEGEATEDDSGSDEEGSLDSDESSGKDWSDLEEEAARADRRREEEDRDGGGRSKHKHSSHHKSSKHSPSKHSSSKHSSSKHSPSKHSSKRHGDDRRGGPPSKKRR